MGRIYCVYQRFVIEEPEGVEVELGGNEVGGDKEPGGTKLEAR